MRWAKRIIAVLVVVGLVLATKDAVQRWRAEVTTVQVRVEDIDQQLDSVSQGFGEAASREVSTGERQRLIDERIRLLGSLPTWQNVSFGSIILAAMFYAVGLLPPACVLHGALRGFHVPCSLARATAAQLLGHAGKYVPGKAMVVVLRVSAIVSTSRTDSLPAVMPDVPSRQPLIGRATTCVFFETLLMMSVGGALAGCLMWSTPLPQWVKWAASLMAVGACIPTLPPVMRRVIELVSKRRARSQSSDSTKPDAKLPDVSSAITWPRLLSGWGWSLLSWCLIGLSFACVMKAIPAYDGLPVGHELLTVATAAISLGMVLGFASLLPGGAGVREWVTLVVLGTVTDPTHALLCVITARILFIVVESVLALVSHLYLRTVSV
ncbi:lysylphosphatidylglycerol synthase domain-containing protein [Rhodopirellula bahusiensis]|uniref:lysylphosphatidylglycerol synthase domain-containing protein n=2 Tax=Rhodopirellula bahusiensis TaxID=2014065 RepID=UPI003265A98E